MHARWALAFALVAVLATTPAQAWQEAHQTGLEAHLLVDAHGMASVEHEVWWHVVRGPLRSIDLVHFPPGAIVEPLVSIASEDGRSLGGRAVRREDGTVRITVDNPQALERGTFRFAVRSRVDLFAAQALSRDGATWRLSWTDPAATDGVDGSRLTLDIPSAPDEPRPIVAETGAIDDSIMTSVRRGTERDVLELVRARVARGESATWTIRLDPRALPSIELQPVSEPGACVARKPDRLRYASLGALLAAVGVSFGMLVQCKARAFGRVCAVRGGAPRGLMPLADRPRAVVAGLALAAAVGIEWVGEPILGAACLSIAMLAATLRGPNARQPVRGPGRWRALRPEDAFALCGGAGHWLDGGSAVGRAVALGVGAFVIATAFVAHWFDSETCWLAALDATALVPLFVTGRAAQLPPDGVESAVPWLSGAFRRLRAIAGVRVTPWARVAPDGGIADELRLLVVPRVAMSGVIGLEVGLAWSSTPVCWAATPEVLVRVVDGSDAAKKLASELPCARSTQGRRPDERVIRLVPRAPTRSSTVALVRVLADTLAYRRAATNPAVPS